MRERDQVREKRAKPRASRLLVGFLFAMGPTMTLLGWLQGNQAEHGNNRAAAAEAEQLTECRERLGELAGATVYLASLDEETRVVCQLPEPAAPAVADTRLIISKEQAQIKLPSETELSGSIAEHTRDAAGFNSATVAVYTGVGALVGSGFILNGFMTHQRS